MPLPRLVEDADKLCKPSDLRGQLENATPILA